LYHDAQKLLTAHHVQAKKVFLERDAFYVHAVPTEETPLAGENS